MSEFIIELRRRFWRATMLGLPRGMHMTRYSMYRRLTEVGKQLRSQVASGLSISHSKHLMDMMGVKPAQITEANYPEYTITSLPFENDQFDIVTSDQVFEHVEGDPFTAMEESRRVLKPGGIAVHTTVFAFPVHGSPSDFWRYTPDALRLLCRKFSNVIECGGWGSFEALQWMRRGLHFDPVPHATWHPLHKVATRTDPEWPIVTWIVAQK
ncbi:MAG TPA: class I SAM-dependent methyltransferase [Povalibacter sp.]|uniref:class I SAM-dependent methyltransferase n=1 Tax=Povalibacter sp. TaxID=1962978 RepID=UPI002CFD0AAA|nr:class I SAM-dependent methyltransferase [Povalibacter sp.]HMN42973.1 class I SAM-dependent methyltransferase [Povalibacter sp.]